METSKSPGEQKPRKLGRGDFLKLSGGALGVGALAYSAGWLSHSPLPGVHQDYPAYIDDGTGLPVFRGPYLQQAQLAAFLLEVDKSRLDALCDQYLNTPADGVLRYVPLISSVVMIYADMRVSSQDGRDGQVGSLPETELSFWILTMAMRKAGPIYLPHHLAWFLPYLYADESNAIATGREVYGFHKQKAQFEKPQTIQQPEFSADVIGFDQFAPTAQGKLEHLLSLRQTVSPAAGNSIPASAPAVWTDLAEARLAIEQAILSDVQAQNTPPMFETVLRLAAERAPLVFLKQFRAAAHTELACYQAVIEAPIKVDQFFEGGFFDRGYALRVNPLASHPLAERLGLNLVQDEQLPGWGAWMKVNFVLESGVEVCRVI